MGEFTLVISGATAATIDPGMLLDEVDGEEAAGMSRSDAVRAVASRHGVSRRELYEAVIRGRGGA
jgi:16S rRNA (cytidine1402-2'-O)-methyltransferase